MDYDADVIISGAGPSGSSAAYFLGEAGFSVLVLEKCELPRYKICAGGVPTSALDYFPFSFDSVLEQDIDRATFVFGYRQVTLPISKGALVMVMRDKFDYLILSKAWAEIIQNTEVQTVIPEDSGYLVKTRQGKSFRSRYVLAADGPNSRVANAMGLRKGRVMGVALEVEAKVPRDLLQSFQGRFLVGFGMLESGYYWIFPKSGHLSVGLGSMQKGAGRKLFYWLSQIMQKYQIETYRFPQHVHRLPVYEHSREPLQKGGVLLLGDAAGLIDPLTGEGIRHAIESGYLAARSIINQNIDSYTGLINKQISRELYYARLLSEFFYSHQGIGFEYLVRNKIVIQDLIRIITHRAKYHRLVFKTPLYLLNFWQRVPLN